MDRQVVLHDTDAGGPGIIDIDEFAHAISVVHGGAPFGELDLAPSPMRVEGDEEIDGPVAAVLIIVALALSVVSSLSSCPPFIKRSGPFSNSLLVPKPVSFSQLDHIDELTKSNVGGKR
jgi:hypothetical protein